MLGCTICSLVHVLVQVCRFLPNPKHGVRPNPEGLPSMYMSSCVQLCRFYSSLRAIRITSSDMNARIRHSAPATRRKTSAISSNWFAFHVKCCHIVIIYLCFPRDIYLSLRHHEGHHLRARCSTRDCTNRTIAILLESHAC